MCDQCQICAMKLERRLKNNNLYLILMCLGYLLIIPEKKEKGPIDLIHPPINISINDCYFVWFSGECQYRVLLQEYLRFERKQDYVTVKYLYIPAVTRISY